MGRPRKGEEKSAKGEAKIHFDISQETKNSIWGVLSFIFAVLSVLSFFNKSGQAGEVFNQLSRSFFGWGFFVIPIAFTLLGASFIKSISRKIYLSALLGTTIFVLSFLAMFFIIGDAEFETRLTQGGYLGVVFGYPLLRSVGFMASTIILVSLLFISVLLTLNVPVYRLVKPEEDEQSKDKGLMDKLIIKKGDDVMISE